MHSMTRVWGKLKTRETYLSAAASKSETRTMRKPTKTLGMKVMSVMNIISRLTLRSRTLSKKTFFSYLRKRTMR